MSRLEIEDFIAFADRPGSIDECLSDIPELFESVVWDDAFDDDVTFGIVDSDLLVVKQFGVLVTGKERSEGVSPLNL